MPDSLYSGMHNSVLDYLQSLSFVEDVDADLSFDPIVGTVSKFVFKYRLKDRDDFNPMKFKVFYKENLVILSSHGAFFSEGKISSDYIINLLWDKCFKYS